MEFAIEVRQAILRDKPQVVALELPATLQHYYLRAVARLPEISVIFYPDEKEEGRAMYIPWSQPIRLSRRSVQRSRSAPKWSSPIRIRASGPPCRTPTRIPYSIRRIGLDKYIEAYRVYPQPRSDEIARHADGIAWKLEGCDPLARVLVVVSLNLLDPLLDSMEQPQAQPMLRVRRDGVQLVNPHPECLAEITVEYPYLQHRYEQFRLLMTDGNLIDRRHVQSIALYRDAEKSYEASRPANAWPTGSAACWPAMHATWPWPITG